MSCTEGDGNLNSHQAGQAFGSGPKKWCSGWRDRDLYELGVNMEQFGPGQSWAVVQNSVNNKIFINHLIGDCSAPGGRRLNLNCEIYIFVDLFNSQYLNLARFPSFWFMHITAFQPMVENELFYNFNWLKYHPGNAKPPPHSLTLPPSLPTPSLRIGRL